MKGSLANGGVVFSSHVDDRYRNVGRFETVPQLDARPIAQTDVEQDATPPSNSQ